MIVEMRTYTLHPGKVGPYLALYEAEGLETQTRILGKLVGYYSTEVGDVNQVVHLWAYADLNERQEKWGKWARDPRRTEIMAKLRGVVLSQSNKILSPTDFSAMK